MKEIHPSKSSTAESRAPSGHDDSRARIIKEEAAAKYIGMSVAFLRQSRMNSKLANRTPGPVFIKVGRAILYNVTDLDAWLSAHRVEGRDGA